MDMKNSKHFTISGMIPSKTFGVRPMLGQEWPSTGTQPTAYNSRVAGRITHLIQPHSCIQEFPMIILNLQPATQHNMKITQEIPCLAPVVVQV